MVVLQHIRRNFLTLPQFVRVVRRNKLLAGQRTIIVLRLLKDHKFLLIVFLSGKSISSCLVCENIVQCGHQPLEVAAHDT